MCGCIPIVPSSPLNPLYQKLPVWIVNNWNEVTPINMYNKYNEISKNITTDSFKLSFKIGIEELIKNL